MAVSCAATIAAEMGETVRGSAHYNALFAIGALLSAGVVTVATEEQGQADQKGNAPAASTAPDTWMAPDPFFVGMGGRSSLS